MISLEIGPVAMNKNNNLYKQHKQYESYNPLAAYRRSGVVMTIGGIEIKPMPMNTDWASVRAEGQCGLRRGSLAYMQGGRR